jgi:hypothetical protein
MDDGCCLTEAELESHLGVQTGSLKRPISLLPTFRKGRFKGLHKGCQTHACGLTPLSQLHQVQPPLATLEFADFGLGFFKSLCQLYLRNSLVLAALAEQPTENPVISGERRLLHGGRLKKTAAQIKVLY